MIHFTIGKYDVTLHAKAKRLFTEIIKVKSESYIHLVWYRFSLIIEDWTLEVHRLCASCDSVEVSEQSIGDESWTICSSCKSVEQGYRYVNLREYEKH